MKHSAVPLTCIKLPHGFKTFVLSIFEWPLKTGFTVFQSSYARDQNRPVSVKMETIAYAYSHLLTPCMLGGNR